MTAAVGGKGRRGLAAFGGDERGGATIELVVWIPFFLSMMFALVEASLLAFRYAQMWDATREAARLVALGVLPPDRSLIGTWVQDRLTPDFAVSVVHLETVRPTLSVAADVSDVSVFGMLTLAVEEVRTTVPFTLEPLAGGI
ncbi:MAG: TadE/TadG family type IV pilus assembly protein [Pseudomonadota bacterium]